MKRESVFVHRLLPSYEGSDKGGCQGDKGFQQTGNEVANDKLNPPHTFDDPHAHTFLHNLLIAPKRSTSRGRGRELDLGQKSN